MNKPVESVSAAALDPILMEVVRYKLESITEEMQSSLIRGSFSPIVKEALDASCCLFTPDGTTVAQSRSNPSHLGSLIYSVKAILEHYPTAAMRDGDIYIFNDPYLGGTHIPDIAVVVPVIGDGKVIALTASIAHHIDLGGTIPGSSAANATDIFHEGLRIPPLQLAHGGRLDDGLMRLIRQNTRMPDTVTGDLNAQIAAGKIAVRRLADLGARYGFALVSRLFEELIARSERMTREALRKLPQGTYTYEDTLDNDGVDLDRRVTIRVAVTISDGCVEFDFAGTSPQVKGPINIVPSGVYSAACYGVRAITDASIPTNGGCFRPVTVKAPAGSLVNPREGAPVNGRTHPMKRIASCIVGALAQALPDRFAAPAAASLLVLTFGGQWPNGRNFVVTDLINGASGGAQGQDGVDCIATDMTNGMSMTEEALEMEAPIRLIRNALRSDCGGAGEFRGGVGIIREYEILHGPVQFSHRGERHFSQARGLLGGGSGASAYSEIRRRDGRVEEIRSKVVTLLEAGDRVLIMTPGGGGYGDPRKRDRAAMERDLADGKVGAESARAAYGMAAT
jgi:N-methylhydantoinase B/oxoprolinase/acetone carboxylase alpha subunit